MHQTDLLVGYFLKKWYLFPFLLLPSMCACEKGLEAAEGICPFRGFAGKYQVVSAESNGDLARV